MARHGMFLSEGIAGLMYLLSGVVFPLSLLPEWVQWIGRGLPTTYWLEGLRRALLGPSPFDSPLATWSHEHIVMALLASTVVLALSAAWAFQAGERRAWRLGRIEETTGV
jgi:ABC-2 type transport system permease protein